MSKLHTGEEYYTISEVCGIVKISKSSVYRLIDRGEFPKPVYLSERSPRWSAEQIHQWFEARTKQ